MTLEQATAKLVSIADDYDRERMYSTDEGYWDGFVPCCQVNGIVGDASRVLLILVDHLRSTRQHLTKCEFHAGELFKYQYATDPRFKDRKHATD